MISWLCLLLGTLVLCFANFQSVVPAAAWVAPVLLLRFHRDARGGWRAWLGIVAAYGVATAVGFRNGLVPIPAFAVAALALKAALERSLPYVLDRRLGPSLPPLARSLVFPVSVVAMELVVLRTSPFGAWGSAAHSQGSPILLQLAAVTGFWGVTFVMAWLASAANAAWEARGEGARGMMPAAAYAIAMAAVLGYGAVRLSRAAEGATVRAAAVVPSVAEYDRAFGGWKKKALATGSDAERARVRPQLARMYDAMLASTEAAADSGATMVAWPESTPVLEEDAPALIERAREVARRRGIHLLATPWIVHRTDRFPFVDNTSVLIAPDGRVHWRYSKSYPVLGIENVYMRPGAGTIPVAETPHGRIASVICQDLDFAWWVRGAGKAGASLLLVPADDWPAVAPMHAAMAPFRAVESGASLLRPTSNGVSIATDAYGRVLRRAMAPAAGPPLVMMADLPAGGIATPYARLGDWFAFLCVLVLAALAAGARARSRARPQPAASPAPDRMPEAVV